MTDTQADLTERARDCVRKFYGWFCGQTNFEEITRLVEAALQSEREAAAEARRVALRCVAKGLVPLYRNDPVEIARLCDEELDRTGNLLGWLREEAALASPTER